MSCTIQEICFPTSVKLDPILNLDIWLDYFIIADIVTHTMSYSTNLIEQAQCCIASTLHYEIL